MSTPLRATLTDELKTSLKEKNEIKTATVRLILAALKDRDISARSTGNCDGIPDEDVLSLFQTMIKQRRESIKMYTDGGRKDLADREEAEIGVIMTFLPKQLSEAEIKQAAQDAIKATGADSVKDMGKVMAVLKDKYAGQMDFSVASKIIKEQFV